MLKSYGMHIDLRVRLAYVIFYIIMPLIILVLRGIMGEHFGVMFGGLSGCPDEILEHEIENGDIIVEEGLEGKAS